jgi:RNA binding exosome subunit
LKSPIRSVEASYLVHATEDKEKIGRAVSRLLSTGTEAEVEKLEGHYGNEILRARLQLTGKEAARAFEGIVSALPPAVKAEISSSIQTLIDEHSALFVRFDKQRLVSGTVSLGSGDSVRVKVKPRVFLVEGGAAKFYLGLLGRR